MKVLIIDNYDSYTFNLYQLCCRQLQLQQQQVGNEEHQVIMIRNNQISKEELRKHCRYFDCIIISPGPGHPKKEEDFGVSSILFQESIEIPILGVCLGHQGLGYYYGCEVVHAPTAMHGRFATINYTPGFALFNNFPEKFQVVLYHSLIISPKSIGNSDVVPMAWSEREVIMAVQHKHLPYYGVQFHPESVGSEYGSQLLDNFFTIVREYQQSCKIKKEHLAQTNDLAWSHLNVVPRNEEDRSTMEVAKNADRSGSDYQAYLYQLDNYIESDVVFDHFYKDRDVTFWLDSAKGDPKRCRFSYLGGLDGPLSFGVTYLVEQRKLQFFHNSLEELQNKGGGYGEWRERVLEDKRGSSTFMDWMKEYLQKFECKTCVSMRTKEVVVPEFDFIGGFVGYFGYEMRKETVSHPLKPSDVRLPTRQVLDNADSVPDASFLFVDRFWIFDHHQRETYLLQLSKPEHYSDRWFREIQQAIDSNSFQAKAVSSSLYSSNWTLGGRWQDFMKLVHPKEEYMKNIETVLDHILNGETYEVNVTTQLYSPADAINIDVVKLYNILREKNAAPYSALLRLGIHSHGVSLCCSSPERFIRIDKNRKVESKPIKGTLPRGETREEDEELKLQLANSEKDRSENLMIVDLTRNDLGNVCEVGSVVVPLLMQVESYASVHQLVSTVNGVLRPEMHSLDCVKYVFPPGSMTGAPKTRTMQIISEVENVRRGPYSGCLGFISVNNAVDLNVIIRTACIPPSGGVSIGAGGAIVALSNPTEEFEEMLLKAKSVWPSIWKSLQP